MQWSCVGHQKQKQYLEQLITNERLAHAYVFAGPEGIGKRMIAEDVACGLTPGSAAWDILRLSPERDEKGVLHDIPIEAIRDQLKPWAALRPTGTARCVIIDDAERLGDEAANNLLKILEEPPQYLHFFLITSRPHKIFPTVLSRCERIDFSVVSDAEMKTILASSRIAPKDARLLAVISSGRPGSVLRLIADKKLPVLAEHIAEFQRVLSASITQKLLYAKKVAESEQAPEIVSWWLGFIRQQCVDHPEFLAIEHNLLELNAVISEPQYNKRLALEHFFLRC